MPATTARISTETLRRLRILAFDAPLVSTRPPELCHRSTARLHGASRKAQRDEPTQDDEPLSPRLAASRKGGLTTFARRHGIFSLSAAEQKCLRSRGGSVTGPALAKTRRGIFAQSPAQRAATQAKSAATCLAKGVGIYALSREQSLAYLSDATRTRKAMMFAQLERDLHEVRENGFDAVRHTLGSETYTRLRLEQGPAQSKANRLRRYAYRLDQLLRVLDLEKMQKERGAAAVLEWAAQARPSAGWLDRVEVLLLPESAETKPEKSKDDVEGVWQDVLGFCQSQADSAPPSKSSSVANSDLDLTSSMQSDANKS